MYTSESAAKWLRDVADMLVEKGKMYGDSIGNPVRIFSQAGQSDGLRVRIDDKLSRIAKGKPGDEDVIKDLVGYLALLAVSEAKRSTEYACQRCTSTNVRSYCEGHPDYILCRDCGKLSYAKT